MFSLCLGKNGGSFFLGGYKESLNIGNITWVPFIENQKKYKIQLYSIGINDQEVY